MKSGKNSIDGVYMIEPFLIGFKGHLYNYAKSIDDNLDKSKFVFKIFVSNNCEPKILNNINASPVFDKIPIDKYFKSFFGKLFISVFVFNKHLYNGLRKISKNNKLNNKILFFGTIQHIHFLGLIFWLLFSKSNNRPSKIILTLRLSIYRYDKKRWALPYYWYLLSLKLINLLKSKYNIYLITDSQKLVTEFSKLTKQEIFLLPIPHTHNPNSNQTINQNLIISSLGGARKNKGVDLIIDSIFEISKISIFNNVKFLIQANCNQDDYYMMEKINELRKYNFSNVEIIDNELSEKKYYDTIYKSDIVLIPYDLGIYYSNTSGIFTEAMSLGKPVIVTEGTWMSDNLCDNCGLLVKNRDVNDLKNKIILMISKFDEYKSNSLLNSSKWNQFHNAKNFVFQLLNIGN
jgi:glycosyltransferase involved in cell wall biosynthesis